MYSDEASPAMTARGSRARDADSATPEEIWESSASESTGRDRLATTLRTRLCRVLDCFLHPNGRAPDIDRLYRARLVVALSGLLIVMAVFYGMVFQFMGSPVGAAVLYWGAALGFVSLFVIRATGSSQLAGNVLTAAFFATLTSLACRLGGHGAHALAWYAGVPVVALSMVGRRSALIWLVVTATTLAGFYVIHTSGYPFPNDLTPEQYKLLGLLSWIGLILLILGLSLLYQAAKDQMLRLIQESRQRYRAVVEDMPLLMCTVRPDMTLAFVNEACCRYFHTTREQLLRRSFLDWIPAEERSDVHARIAESKVTPQVYEHPVLMPDGASRLHRWTVRSIVDHKGRQVSYHAIGEDITEQKRAETEIWESRERARRQRNALALLAVDGAIVAGELPEAVTTLTRVAAQTIRVERAGIWLLSEDRTELKCISLYESSRRTHGKGGGLSTAECARYLEALAAECRINARDACADWRTSEFTDTYFRPLGITSLLDAGIMLEGELAGVVCLEHTGAQREWHSDEEAFASTIAALVAQTLVNRERRRAERKAGHSLALAETTLESIDNGILVVDEQRRIVKANTMFARMWRIPEHLRNCDDDDALLNCVLEQLNEPEQFLAKLEELYLHPERESFDTLSFKDGRVFERFSRPMSLTGKTLARVWSFRDVTDLTAARDAAERARITLQKTITLLEEETIRANAMAAQAESASAAKSEFLANMSHEIRSPMTAILGFCDILVGSITDQEQLDAATTIKQNGEYLLGIINDILDLSKIEAGRMEVSRVPCSPAQILSDVVALMHPRAKAKNLTLQLQFDGPIPRTIQSDPTRLRQILINLTGNAIKFTEVGQIRLVARLLQNGCDEPRIQFQVIDSGIGMTEEQISQLFKPFSQIDSSATRRHGGTGLGLAISKRLASKLGGDIVVHCTPTEGSRFTVTVETGPLQGVEMLSRPEKPRVTTDSPRQLLPPQPVLDCRVLLAEDGLDNQRLIAFLLKKAGAEVAIAENGQVACDLALAACRQGRPFDVILMDMQMPVMDGYEATGQLRAAGYRGPIIALTAHAMSSDREKCLQAGCDEYATKPIDRRQLLSLVAQSADQGTTPRVR